MNDLRKELLVFTKRRFPFLEKFADTGRVRVIAEASELIEEVKHRPFRLVVFDPSHDHFSVPLLMRIYRRCPSSDFWLLSDDDHRNLPGHVIDGVVPVSISAREFKARVENTFRLKSLLQDYGMIGKSGRLKQVAEVIAQVSPTDITTLIIGPSGAGKELVAHAIHEHSRRNGKAYVTVNCGALTESLLESELFGHERGAFTGAVGRREGIFKRADGGTVFLDEIGETSPALQVKLLRVLEDGSFYRVGGNDAVRVDTRVIAATNRELTDAIAEGHFREDLYFRLGAVRINVPPLSERKADILPLVYYFYAQEHEGQQPGLSERAMEMLLNYRWPGNVRQLRNFVSRISLTAAAGEISEQTVLQFIEEQGFADKALPVVTGRTSREAEFNLLYQALLSLGQEIRMLRELIIDNLPQQTDSFHHDYSPRHDQGGSVEDMERDLIRHTLESVGGNRREAAKILGIGERTLYRKLKKYGLS